MSLYSPCIRGCFSDEQTKIPNRIVFPMHMGMIPLEKILGQLESGIPHTCGGVSMPSTSEGLSRRYSPHMWGWFRICILKMMMAFVFPTHVGMVLDPDELTVDEISIPRAYGDDFWWGYHEKRQASACLVVQIFLITYSSRPALP